MTNTRPIKLSVAALGGQGGGVLSDWLIEVAESQGYLAQSTSVPGVAQRTGATIYYLEFFPRDVAQRAGREPIMALMPAPGDVDCVVAAELAEAGRVVQRGLVTQDRTTLIASTHRAYTIAERSEMGDGVVDSQAIAEIARAHAKRTIMFDMQELAEKHDSVISAVLLGAIAGARVLPFERAAFEAAIKHAGIAVETNLKAFAAAYDRSATDVTEAPRELRPRFNPDVPTKAQSAAGQSLLDAVRRFPAPLQPMVLAGVRRLVEYQDADYAALYLTRLERILKLEPRQELLDLTEAVARGLALWMSFEDTIRVADLKTRARRIERVRGEVRVGSNQLLNVTEFMKPRVEEIAGTMPAGLGRWVERSPTMSRLVARFTGGKYIRSTTIGGFLLLRFIASFRRRRRGTLRYQIENGRIENWLNAIERIAPKNYGVAVQVAHMQRLVKGYGETHGRGWDNFTTLMGRVDALIARPDGAEALARLQKAALTDEEGVALKRELSALA